ncbi:putative gibberellin 3-beta-dioxygenase 2-3 [Iris pallida]|uniref:Gibberellin 3-beta-dioxygenase 2-3 n=1 Tax=Iris pallida TaxID=29817 RepID=A0AAX6HVR1_IRIPA|nr:putative gibberellin 3-beta-dioxygenase 2-3 [Iris pallida]KAJ6844992.1 putative gibberellin 3-beta-dioxygenase 2-3 [Iris pallida]
MPSLSMETLHDHHPVPHRLDKIEAESVAQVPDSHAWPAHAVHDYPSLDAPSESESVPIIDLSSASGDVVAEIGKACESWGAFQVVGHDAPAELLDSLESEARRLFSLPAHRKLRAAKPPGSITGYGLPPISSFFSKVMWSEGFTISGSPVDDARKLWPQDYARFCEVIEKYNKEMQKLAERLMRLKLLSLGLAGGFRNTTAVLQLNSYPVCPEPDRAMGLAAHTDSGLLTILHQSGAARGLQLLHSDRWVAVPPVRGALVVIVGDLGHVLSNGRFKSVVHRAVVNRIHHRISAAYLCGPSPGVRVSPVGNPADRAYRAVTWREYLGLRAEFFDKAIESIKINTDTEEKNGNGTGCCCAKQQNIAVCM